MLSQFSRVLGVLLFFLLMVWWCYVLIGFSFYLSLIFLIFYLLWGIFFCREKCWRVCCRCFFFPVLFNSLQHIGIWEQAPVPVSRHILCLQPKSAEEERWHTVQKEVQRLSRQEYIWAWCCSYFIIGHVNNTVGQPSQLLERTAHNPDLLNYYGVLV